MRDAFDLKRPSLREIFGEFVPLRAFYKAPFVRFKSAKCLACTINSSERSVYLSFYIYLCHISDILYLSFQQHLDKWIS